MDEATRSLIFKAIDQVITPQEFEQLQDAIEQSDEVCEEYLRAIALSESLGEIASQSRQLRSSQSSAAVEPRRQDTSAPPPRFRLSLLGLAAAVLLTVGGTAFWFGRQNSRQTDVAAGVGDPAPARESRIAGHATLRRSVDLKWPESVAPYRDGDVLSSGRLQFDEGVAEIDFFCGATLIVEGPAVLNIESDWSVEVASGRLRANVPPAARGFIVKAAGSEIVDLGTEFALEVKSENARVEVIDGEVEIRGGEHDGNHLLTGQRQWLKGTDTPEAVDGLSTLDELKRRKDDAAAERLAAWQSHSRQLAQDDRLIAYFPVRGTAADRVVRNTASSGAELDGKLVGPVEHATGRFGPASSGLRFSRPGARVRTRIDGQFKAFTFACWARIDSLEHAYNALFMSDGYETGELHWQIDSDGRLMFSVMVDDTQKIRHFSKLEQREVETAGLARVYYSKPIWDISNSGQWIHLAAVYDPTSRRVVQYANGKQVGDQEIVDKFFIDTLRIGAAEIGNWGQPSRKSPSFAVRNLQGTIDELSIFGASLTAHEIRDLYEKGKPLGY